MNAENGELLKEFTADQVVKLETIIAKHKAKQGGLIPVLEEAQVALEYLPISVQKKIARELNLPFSRVYGVVTFYSFFTMTPRGRHTARVCLGTACYVRGGKALADALKKKFGVEEGGTTPDRKFTYETIRCLGACGLGPVVVVDADVHGRM
ncbi:MAG: NAD(P)H-dependent oxidoreductase subunit E [Thermodesulfobacteriota bacterium]